MLQQAINHYTSKGNFRRAATQQQNLAEIYEIEIGDEKRAVEAYETAAGWFESDHAEAYVLNSRLLQENGLLQGAIRMANAECNAVDLRINYSSRSLI